MDAQNGRRNQAGYPPCSRGQIELQLKGGQGRTRSDANGWKDWRRDVGLVKQPPLPPIGHQGRENKHERGAFSKENVEKRFPVDLFEGLPEVKLNLKGGPRRASEVTNTSPPSGVERVQSPRGVDGWPFPASCQTAKPEPWHRCGRPCEKAR